MKLLLLLMLASLTPFSSLAFAKENPLKCSGTMGWKYTPGDHKVYTTWISKGNDPQFYEVETDPEGGGFPGPLEFCEYLVVRCAAEPTRECLRKEFERRSFHPPRRQ